MTENRLHKIIGFAVFIITALVYFLTVQPSVSFWDTGEFIASAYGMQVPHPPGTPFFLILGRFFSLIPFAENIAFRVNTVSVLSSAFTVLFLYLIAVKLILNYKARTHQNLFDAFGTYLAAAIGALSLAFSSTFWFNGVEAEVYALSTFFIAFVTWMLMLWHEKADEPDNEKYLIMIAYLIGLSTGVHLMSVLGIVPVIMVVMFRKYINDNESLKNTGFIFMGHAAIIILAAVAMWYSQNSAQPPSPEEYKAVDTKFLLIFVGISIIYMGVFWKKIFQRNSFYFPIIIGGIALIAVYPGIVKYFPTLISGIAGNEIVFDIILLVAIFAAIGYLIYWSGKNNKQTLNLVGKAFLFALLGFTSYTQIIIRSNQDPPINLNSPKTFSELVSYLNREQYGDFPTFKRRFSSEPHLQGIYANYSNDLDFFWNYQMNHMFNRYLLWNYAGKKSTVQDSGVDWTQLWAIPFFIGLFGVYYHFKKDWKMASVFLVMFIFLGWLTAFYQNQQQPQPRERDYFYVGAFFVYSIWIALGVRGILDLAAQSLKDSKFKNGAVSLILILAFILVPVKMILANYHENDRSENYVPWDYSYNILQSVAPNGILFTNGDNDTFPLWYLQDVEGVRRDVRIANLSLLNTPWYIKQLKNNEAYGTAGIPMTLSDERIDRISPVRFDAQNVSVPVSKENLRRLGIEDTTIKDLSWKMEPTANYGGIDALRPQDLVVRDIIEASKWDRPVYFAVTVSEDSRLNLDDYLKMEGLAFRLTPVKHKGGGEYVDRELMSEQLFNHPEGYSKDYQPGFKFRGLNNPNIFFDDNHERLTQNYRNSYMRLALSYLNANNNEMVVKTLNEMEDQLPREVIPMDYRLLHDVGRIYYRAGAVDRYYDIAKDVEREALARIEENPKSFNDPYYNPYQMLLEIYENLGEYNKAIKIVEDLKEYFPQDKQLDQLMTQYQAMSAQKNTAEKDSVQ